MKLGGVRFLANVSTSETKHLSIRDFLLTKLNRRIPIKVNPRIMQIRLDRRIEESGDQTWIELFHR